jgi:nucleotide-binding universal stress UspA family protein
MSGPIPTTRHEPPVLVCAVDGSNRAAHTVRAAGWLASELDARVILAHVFDPLGVQVPPSKELALDSLSGTELVDAVREHAGRSLASVAGPLEDVEHTRVVVDGDPVTELLRLVGEHDARLLITGPAPPSKAELVFVGSVTGELAARSTCPVVAVPVDAALAEPGPVLAAYDGSAHSMRAARNGAALAARMGRDLVLLHVTEGDGDPVRADEKLGRELFEAAGRALEGHAERRSLDLHVSIASETGEAVEGISRVARDRRAALIVGGTRGLNPTAAALVGSVSAGVVLEGGRPVVLASPSTTG